MKMKKILAVGVILLFVGVTIPPTIAQNAEKSQSTSRGNWLYVGGSGPGNYTRIQDAIDNAYNGDTVFVYDDSSPYYENLLLTHSINLLGEHRESTIIDGGSTTHAIIIDAENVTVSGFSVFQELQWDAAIEVNYNFFSISDCTIKNTESSGIEVHSKKSFITISNNYFLGLGGFWGIYFNGNNGQNIVNNNFFDASVYMTYGSDTRFENNTFQGSWISLDGFRIILNNNSFNNCHNIEISRESIILRNNILTHCGFSIQSGSIDVCYNNTVNDKPFIFLSNEHDLTIEDAGQVYCEDSSDITIQNLNLEDVCHGIHLVNTEDSIIQNNSMLRCNIRIDESKNIQVTKNTIVVNGTGINSGYHVGIQIGYSMNVEVTGNKLTNCLSSGIGSGGSEISICDNIFVGNDLGVEAGSGHTISGNIFIGNDMGLKVGSGNNITGNHIEKSRIGLILYDASNTIVHQNNFVNNKKDATFSELSRSHGNNWDYNYWDDAFFPFGYKFIFGTIQTEIPRLWQMPPGPTEYYWIRWINFDYHPAQEPYEIPGMS